MVVWGPSVVVWKHAVSNPGTLFPDKFRRTPLENGRELFADVDERNLHRWAFEGTKGHRHLGALLKGATSASLRATRRGRVLELELVWSVGVGTEVCHQSSSSREHSTCNVTEAATTQKPGGKFRRKL